MNRSASHYEVHFIPTPIPAHYTTLPSLASSVVFLSLYRRFIHHRVISIATTFALGRETVRYINRNSRNPDLSRIVSRVMSILTISESVIPLPARLIVPVGPILRTPTSVESGNWFVTESGLYYDYDSNVNRPQEVRYNEEAVLLNSQFFQEVQRRPNCPKIPLFLAALKLCAEYYFLSLLDMIHWMFCTRQSIKTVWAKGSARMSPTVNKGKNLEQKTTMMTWVQGLELPLHRAWQRSRTRHLSVPHH